uniref:Uncharacterized protein n=1 Tax=Rhizophora mucronata TaxID=61149 RepID=A0A2P2LTW5_RHIMU
MGTHLNLEKFRPIKLPPLLLKQRLRNINLHHLDKKLNEFYYKKPHIRSLDCQRLSCAIALCS